MKIHALDVLNGQFQKNWQDLGLNLDLNEVSDYSSGGLATLLGEARQIEDPETFVLIVIHAKLQNCREAVDAINLCAHAFALIVSAGMIENAIEMNPAWGHRIHASNVSFPNSPDTLFHLRPRLEILAASLQNATGEVAIREAFRRFDTDDLGEFAVLTSPFALSDEWTADVIVTNALTSRLLVKLANDNWCKAVAAQIGGLKELKDLKDHLLAVDAAERSNQILNWIQNRGNLVKLARCL